jgi:hypothetical protein
MSLEGKKELFSEKVSVGSRTYFFDVKESVDEVKYLVITESREVGEGTRKRNRVMIFQDNMSAFNEGFIKAIEFMFGKNESKAYSIQEIRQKYPKAYERWTESEDMHLKNGFNQSKTIDELANIFQRKPNAIRSRLQKMGLL